jgi:hypothetical protein
MTAQSQLVATPPTPLASPLRFHASTVRPHVLQSPSPRPSSSPAALMFHRSQSPLQLAQEERIALHQPSQLEFQKSHPAQEARTALHQPPQRSHARATTASHRLSSHNQPVDQSSHLAPTEATTASQAKVTPPPQNQFQSTTAVLPDSLAQSPLVSLSSSPLLSCYKHFLLNQKPVVLAL